MAARIRGSVFDTITLEEFPFLLEPKLKEKSTTTFGKQHIIGHRLPDYNWVGNGESHVELDVYIIRSSGADTKDTILNLKSLTLSKDDLGAPHPVYLNVGEMFAGKKFVMVDFESEIVTFDYDDAMHPAEAKLKMKFEEIPLDGNFSGTGSQA